MNYTNGVSLNFLYYRHGLLIRKSLFENLPQYRILKSWIKIIITVLLNDEVYKWSFG